MTIVLHTPPQGAPRAVGGISMTIIELDKKNRHYDRHFGLHPGCPARLFSTYVRKTGAQRDGNGMVTLRKKQQVEWRWPLCEFNLVYDRGTTFCLKTRWQMVDAY